MRRLNLVGETFHKLTVLEFSHVNNDKKTVWLCECECGRKVHVAGKNLKNGNTKSCGCISAIRIAAWNYKHGHCSKGKTPEYHIWRSMVSRCTNPNAKDYPDYGGRGITVDANWKTSFKTFIDDMGVRPSKRHWLDRVDNSGGYSKDNCAWRTIEEQQNNKRTNRILTLNGKSLTVSQWSKELGIPAQTIAQRLHRGGSISKALSV